MSHAGHRRLVLRLLKQVFGVLLAPFGIEIVHRRRSELHSLGLGRSRVARLCGTFPTLAQQQALGPRDAYFIQPGYRCRSKVRAFDVTGIDVDERWQEEVYKYARETFDDQSLRGVCDIGCGTGAKLLEYFEDQDTLGLEVSPTYEWLLDHRPQRKWMQSVFSTELVQKYDLIISADVIEHLPNPDDLMYFMVQNARQYVVISTPDRDLIRAAPYLGPPENPHHFREWSFMEFRRYVSEFLDVEEHFIANSCDCTQCILGKV